MRQLFLSDFFLAEENVFARYRWPADHVVGTLKLLGPGAFSLSSSLPLLRVMGEVLFDPPTVEGYKSGPT